MREIEFRGIAFNTGKFVYGDLTLYSQEKSMITVDLIEGAVYDVKAETVGQFTGFVNNGQKWYEGDILESDMDWYRIEWDGDEGRWEAVGVKGTHERLALHEVLSSETWVQGNIYENPELLRSEDTSNVDGRLL